jgi:hypothetical protein
VLSKDREGRDGELRPLALLRVVNPHFVEEGGSVLASIYQQPITRNQIHPISTHATHVRYFTIEKKNGGKTATNE